MIRIKVFDRPGHYNRFSEWVPDCYCAVLMDDNESPICNGKTVNEAIVNLLERLNIDPNKLGPDHIEIVYR